MASRPDIHLYTTQTPNGIKISITLEELGLPYKHTKIDISKNTQKEPWFLEINPNGRIPALTDTFEDGKTIRLFESGSIQQYLVDQYDKDHKISYPRGTREYYEMNNWVSSYHEPPKTAMGTEIPDSFSSKMLELDQCKDKPTISTATLPSAVSNPLHARKNLAVF
jgi:glutathione S-transferase